jgi:homoserine kinase
VTAFTVRVPATTANLGPGFDSCGMALGLYDEVRAEPGAAGVRIEIAGEGAGNLPSDERHLIAATVLRIAADLGSPLPGLTLTCRNRIPHGRGLGSSAAAIVAGVLLGRALAGADRDPRAELAAAAVAEGHPDNVAPALLGGFTVAWSDGGPEESAAVSLPVHADLCPVVFVAAAQLATHAARGLLPASVPFGDAVFNTGRAALLTAAVTARPDLLAAATADRLHQDARRTGYPDSWELVATLRAEGHAAAISGAGPTVLALPTDPAAADALAARGVAGFTAQRLAVDADGATLHIG